MAYNRFVVSKKDSDSQKRGGLFHAISDLVNSGALAEHEHVVADELGVWFTQNLPVPRRFAKSRAPRAKNVAISWFKDSAVEHIRKMHEVVQILAAHGIPVDVITTDRPGYVVYEDAHQITAEPFRDSGA